MKTLNVLVVDNESHEVVAGIVEQQAIESGYFERIEVESVATPDEAQQRFGDERFDLLVLDYELDDDLTAVDVCRRIDPMDSLKTTKTIVFTGKNKYMRTEYLQKSLSAGALTFMQKGTRSSRCRSGYFFAPCSRPLSPCWS
jgi:DNA-binding response OmpR family regulator